MKFPVFDLKADEWKKKKKADEWDILNAPKGRGEINNPKWVAFCSKLSIDFSLCGSETLIREKRMVLYPDRVDLITIFV